MWANLNQVKTLLVDCMVYLVSTSLSLYLRKQLIEMQQHTLIHRGVQRHFESLSCYPSFMFSSIIMNKEEKV